MGNDKPNAKLPKSKSEQNRREFVLKVDADRELLHYPDLDTAPSDADVDLCVLDQTVEFDYQMRNRDGTLERRHRVAAIERTPCRFGSTRTWFICPLPGCGRRVTTLYIDDGEVGCRHCQDFRYSSQSERAADRAMRRERRIRKKLRMGPNLTVPITAKPKGMHWRTFLRLRSEAYRYNAAGLADTLRFLKKCGRRV